MCGQGRYACGRNVSLPPNWVDFVQTFFYWELEVKIWFSVGTYFAFGNKMLFADKGFVTPFVVHLEAI